MRKNAKKKLLAVALIGTLLCSTALSGIAVAADGVVIDETNFPDPVFRQKIQDEGWDLNNDGELSKEELEKVTEISFRISELANPKGIEHFTNVTRIDMTNTRITEIDVSKNLLLKDLDVSETILETLDVTNNPSLERLQASWMTHLKVIDASNNPSLKWLGVWHSAVKEINVSKSPLLDEVNIFDTRLMSLELHPDAPLTNLKQLESERVNLGNILSSGYDLKAILPNTDFTKMEIKTPQGVTIDPTTGIMSGYTKETTEIAFRYDTGNENYPIEGVFFFTVKEADTDKYEAKATAVTKDYGVQATEDDIKKAISLVELATNATVTEDEKNNLVKDIVVKDGAIPTPSADGTPQTVTVEVTYQDDSKDEVQVTINYGKATDVYNPQPTALKVNKGERPNAETAIQDVANLPAGTTYEWKTLDTSAAGQTTGTVLVTYPDQSTDEVTVAVEVVETTTPTEIETQAETQAETKPETETETQAETKPATEPTTEPETNPTTEPVTEAETNPTTEPTTEAETKPVATSSNATKNGSKSSGSKKPSASTNGSVGPADNTNTNTTEPTANTNEAMVAADNANTDGTESLVNAAMKGLLPKTGDMMNLNLTLAGLLGSLTGLVGLVASKKRKKY